MATSLAVLALAGMRGVLAAETLALAPEDLPRLLAERNQAVRGAAINAESFELRTGHLVRSYLPTLNLEGGGEHFQTGPYPNFSQLYGSAEARLNLFRGGKDLLEDGLRSAQSRAATAQARMTTAAQLAEARRAYWTLVFQREEVQILKAAIEENASHIASANRRIQRGLTTDTDRLDFELQASELKEDLESVTHQTKQTQIRLRAALGIAEDVEIKTVESTPHEHDEELLTVGLDAEAQHDISFLKANFEVARKEGSQLSRWWLPSVDAYAGVYLYTLRDRDYLAQGLRDDRVLGLRLTLNLEGFTAANAARAAAMRADGLESEAAQRTRDLRARLQVTQEEMKHEHELTHGAEERVKRGKVYLSRTLSEYDRGVKNGPDVLNASQRVLGFRRRLLETRRNYQLAKLELLSIIGK
jgi:outer membrane protein